jgi:nucleotidyltransferase substrate binding protein (TIGR01987 family)
MAFSELLSAYENALRRLAEVLEEPESAMIRDAAIKRFEFTFELLWKSLQKFFRGQGIACNSPKGCLREAFSYGLVEDNPMWLRMIDDRNLTVHTYNEAVSIEIYQHLKDYMPLFNQVLQSLKDQKDSSNL